MNRLPKFVQCSDDYTLLLFHVGKNDTAGETWAVSTVTSSGGSGQGHGSPCSFLLNTVGKGNGCEKGNNAVGQKLAAKWILGEGFGLYNHKPFCGPVFTLEGWNPAH